MVDCVDAVMCDVDSNSFSCLNPYNAKYQDVKERLTSFEGKWKGCVPANELAEAGFYFYQSPDRARCFYCGGGLQRWRPFENPWFEHAKWFPLCEFLLSKQGVAYVKNVVEENLKLNRAQIHNASKSEAVQEIRGLLKANEVKRVDLRGDRNMDQILKSNKHVNYIRSVGVEERRVKHAVSSLLRRTQEFDQDDLWREVFSLPKNLDNLLCPSCSKREQDTFLIPCGHLGLCWQCEKESKPFCWVCRERPTKIVRLYRF